MEIYEILYTKSRIYKQDSGKICLIKGIKEIFVQYNQVEREKKMVLTD